MKWALMIFIAFTSYHANSFTIKNYNTEQECVSAGKLAITNSIAYGNFRDLGEPYRKYPPEMIFICTPTKEASNAKE